MGASKVHSKGVQDVSLAHLWTASSFLSATAENVLSIAVVWITNVFTWRGGPTQRGRTREARVEADNAWGDKSRQRAAWERGMGHGRQMVTTAHKDEGLLLVDWRAMVLSLRVDVR